MQSEFLKLELKEHLIALHLLLFHIKFCFDQQFKSTDQESFIFLFKAQDLQVLGFILQISHKAEAQFRFEEKTHSHVL